MDKNTNPQTPPTENRDPAAPAAWIGLDWGHRTHAFALQDAAGRVEEGSLEHTPEALHDWLGQLARRYGARPVRLALEGRGGAALPALLQYPWLQVYPVNPVTSARYRKAFTPSGASDDLPDARILLELVRDHAAKLRPLEVQDDSTRHLNLLVQARRDAVNRRTQVLNQLTSLLKSYYPQALQLVDRLDSELALAFLSRWPDLLALKKAKPATVKSFYYLHHARRPETVQQRLDLIPKARLLSSDPMQLEVARRQLCLLLDQLKAFRKHIARFDQEIQRAFAAHPEAALFRDLPGAGAQMAPRLCAAFGTARNVYPEPAALQKLCGVAPVREKSGDRLWTHWRWLAPTFLRQTFVEWSGQTVLYSAWAKRYYEQMTAKGKSRHVILRALAFKWIRILWKCWKERQPYDEARYLKQLAHRKSKYATAA
jgi:Transposase/Transposase IS116/IS110/IS902 family